jgi:hypothetical protein
MGSIPNTIKEENRIGEERGMEGRSGERERDRKGKKKRKERNILRKGPVT